jgi:hypothetical protein
MELRVRSNDTTLLRIVIVVALFVSCGATSASVFEDYRQLEPYGAGATVGDTPVETKIGHLTLTLKNGSLYPIRAAAGRHVGWFFQGDGHYSYRTEDPDDRTVFQGNVRRVNNRLKSGEDSLWDDFKEMLILTAGIELPGLSGEAAGPAAGPAAGGDAAKRFEAMWRSVQLGDLEFDHYAASIDANGPPDQYAYVEMAGEIERIGYIYDRHRSWLERVFSFRKFQGVDYRFRESLSQQVLPGRDEALADLVLRHADLEVATPDNREGTIGGKLSLEVARDGLQIGVLYLMNNRDPASERWQSDKKALKITRWVDGSGTPLDYSHRYDEIAIDFGRPLARGEKVEIQFAADAAIFTDSGGEYADTFRDLYSVNWFPIPRSTGGRRFTYTLDLSCKPPFYPVASGDTVFEGQEDGLNVVRSRSDRTVNDVAVFFGKYTKYEKKFGDLTVKVHGYGLVRKPDLEQMAQVTANFMAIYSQLLGPYPHGEIDVVELPTYGFFGISPPGLILLTSRSVQVTNAFMRDFLGNRGVNSLIAHEVAHQWFGHRAWPSDWLDDNWLSESLAEYMSGVAMALIEQRSKEDKSSKNKGLIKGFKTLHAEWWRFTREAEGVGTIRTANRLSGNLADEYRVRLLYSRGPLVLHQLRTLIGDQRFIQIMRDFLDTADYGPAGTDDLAVAASKVVGENLDWYFDQWLNQSGIPQVEVEHRIVTEAGKTFLTGEVRQTGEEFFKLHVPLILEMAGGKREVRLVFQQQPTQSFRFELAAVPTKVVVDPSGNNLAEYH